jgi:hypothetical protein
LEAAAMKSSLNVGAVLTAFAVVASAPGGARTDSPQPAVKKTFWSPNRRFFAVTEPEEYVTTVYRSAPGGVEEKVWSMYGWFAFATLADDGEHLIVNHWGELIPLDYDKQRVVLYFFKRGELINLVRLDQIIQNNARLLRTESHYYWGSRKGLDQAGRYVVETVEGRTIQFDVATGRAVKVTESQKPPRRPDEAIP